MRQRSAIATLALASLVVLSASILAGPLDPPVGPVSPTPGPEPRIAINATNTPGDADSLFKITQPGSYYLTGNITGVIGKHGIEIAASGVTIDLNGFDLVGIPGMGAFDGVSVTVDSLRGIAVLNGSVRDWGDGGVDLGFLSRGCRVEGVRASGNAGTGITASISSTVTNCTASFNGQRGIFASNGSTISNCSVESNTGNGIQVNQGCTVSACGAYFNTLDGVFAGTGCRVVDTAAYQNQGDGIQVGEGSSVAGCTSTSNGAIGINVGNSCTVSDCAASFNAEGIRAALGGTVQECSARSNTTLGIVCDGRATIRGCTATANGTTGIDCALGVVANCASTHNGEDGIRVLNGNTVIDCTVTTNTGNGIRGQSANLIRGNTCNLNGVGAGNGAGIFVTGLDNRVQANVCVSADRGIEILAAGNFITGNTCGSNTTDWVIAAGNAIGPILDRRNPGGAAVNGFSAPTTLNTTDPHANFSH